MPFTASYENLVHGCMVWWVVVVNMFSLFFNTVRPGTAAAVIYGGCTETGRYQSVVVVHLLWVNETWMNVFFF
jgi:hypothetical protein